MRILLGISGGIAAYKTPELLRGLQKRGHTLRCVLTENARQLVSPQALLTLSGAAVRSELWSADGSIPHIETVRWCEMLLIAPATANCLAKCALGLADDLLTTCFLALEPTKPCWMAPAMNTVMWQKPIVQHHLATLRQGGTQIIDPVSGSLACGEEGMGAMAAVSDIIDAVCADQ